MIVESLATLAEKEALGVAEVSARLSASIERWNLAHRSLYPTAVELGERGWTVPVWSHTMATAEIVARTSPSTVDQYFVDAYSRSWRRLERKVINELLAARSLASWEGLLAEAIFPYRRGRFRVVLPALFAIYDGYLAFAMGQLARKTDPKHLARAKRDQAKDGLVKLAWVSVESFTQTAYAPHPFSSSRPRTVNRNWVLHGRDSSAWTRADCLRLFQALHTVAFLEEVVGVPPG
jgi:hypothetical protein